MSVSNVEEAGSVSLSSTAPQVGHRHHRDAFGPGRERVEPAVALVVLQRVGHGRRARPRRGWKEPTEPPLLRRLPPVASCSDCGCGHAPCMTTATAPARAPKVPRPTRWGPPWAPQDFAADPGAGQVELSWSAPSRLGGLTLQRYEYRHRASGGRWSDWTSAGLATEQTVSSLTNGTEYTFEVRAVNEAGEGLVAQTTATPIQPNRAPTLTGPEDPSGNENSTSSLGTYTASDPDDDTLTWSLSGSDDSAFELKGSGTSRTLHFDSAPNYEAKSSYAVTVRSLRRVAVGQRGGGVCR